MAPRAMGRGGALRVGAFARWSGGALALACVTGGCNWLIGLDDVGVGGATGTQSGSGGTAPTGGTTGTSGTGGSTTPAGGTGGSGGTTGGTGGSGGTTTPAGGTGGSGAECQKDADCVLPLVCDQASGTCVEPTCNDSKKDGTETGVDCGGPSCPPCGDGVDCQVDADCLSGVCAGTCQATECGDGLVWSGEQCDDGNGQSGDGCSSACRVEPQYQCRRAPPTTCSKQETRCLDALDNDGDGLVDSEDTDCFVPAYYPSLGCGSISIYRSVNVPMDIPDNSGAGAWSTIVVPDEIAILHMSVVLRVTHPRDSDVAATLFMPFGQPRTLMEGNGGNGGDYHDTVFDSACPLSISNGAPPFADCFKPLSFLPSSGQLAIGTWSLEVEDRASGQTGTLDGWTLVICTP